MKNLKKCEKNDRSGYPESLDKSPDKDRWPHFWSLGNLGILEQELLGFYCSNKCTGDAILRTYDLARQLRDAGIPVISGFHSTMEKECFELLLRGDQPIVICPARSIQNYRIPKTWREGIDEGRILLISPFDEKHTQPSAQLAETRNRLVAALATNIFIAHAEPGSKTDRFCREQLKYQKSIYMLESCTNSDLFELGVKQTGVTELVQILGGRNHTNSSIEP